LSAAGNIPQYFEFLFKIYGVEKSGFNIEILHSHRVNVNKIHHLYENEDNSTVSGEALQLSLDSSR
jgi:hypothetical protein